MAIVDIQPRVMMCPLPKGYWWEVELIQRLNSVHLRLHKGRFRAVTELTSRSVVRDFWTTPIDRAASEIINGSYEMWQEYVAVPEDRDAWHEKADQLRARLSQGPAQVKITVDTVKPSKVT